MPSPSCRRHACALPRPSSSRAQAADARCLTCKPPCTACSRPHQHLTHLKIGVMGCVVNGPGEMADADYGYVGAAVGKISLYKGKECIEKNIPEDEAIPRLITLD